MIVGACCHGCLEAGKVLEGHFACYGHLISLLRKGWRLVEGPHYVWGEWLAKVEPPQQDTEGAG